MCRQEFVLIQLEIFHGGRSALMAGAILGLVFSLATPVAQKDEGAAAVAQEDEAAALAARAAALQQAGKYSEAIPLAQQVIAIREKQLGPEHPDVAEALANLGHLYFERGRFDDAELPLGRAQAIFEQARGHYQPEQLAFVLKNLGEVYIEQRRDDDAESLLRRALAIQEKEFGPVHRLLAYTLSRLAYLYRAQGRLADAEALFQRALAIDEKTLGPNHPEVASVPPYYAYPAIWGPFSLVRRQGVR
jgi:tetratricopeptide (TPR) repeat protein